MIYYGNNLIGDDVNNNERVFIKEPEIGLYQVTVRGTDISVGACDNRNSIVCQKISVVSASSGGTSRYIAQFGFGESQYYQILIGFAGGLIFFVFFCALSAIICALESKKIVKRDPQTIYAEDRIPVIENKFHSNP